MFFKSWIRFTALFACVFAVAAFDRMRHDINQLSWMAGCWESNARGRVLEEQWLAPRGGMMLGHARTVQAGKVIDYETTRIQQHGDTVMFYATPLGQPPGSFRATRLTGNEVVFENLKHDFPQRVMYSIRNDSLLAAIEGEMNGTTRRIDFPMKRTACGGTPR